MLVPDPRDRLRARLGEGPYKGLFSLISAVGLGLMIYGFYTTRGALEPDDYLYAPRPGRAMPRWGSCSWPSSSSVRRTAKVI